MIKLTNNQIYKLKKALESYKYIQKEYKLSHNNTEFQKNYYQFYLKAAFRWFPKKSNNKKIYFKKLFSLKSNESVETLLKKFYPIFNNSYQLSIISKLVHTVRPETTPIYDKNVRHFLETLPANKRVQLVDYKTKNLFERSLISWKRLNNFYKKFMKTPEARQWIAYFNKTFKEYSWISNIKKIDFIMFILGAEK